MILTGVTDGAAGDVLPTSFPTPTPIPEEGRDDG
jgi:hypothetical protein